MPISRNLLLLSNSTMNQTSFLEYAAEDICTFLRSQNVPEVLFVPYALNNQDKYADTARKTFEGWGFKLTSLHTCQHPASAVAEAKAIFIGGGNSFQLLNYLYQHKLLDVIRKQVLDNGVPFIGSSAGTNVATVSINTTNDMPIVYPPSLQALGLVPFNINTHFIDIDSSSLVKVETRERRVLQYHMKRSSNSIHHYHEIAGSPPVLALREGAILRVIDDKAELVGKFPARLFVPRKETVECPPGQDLSFLLKQRVCFMNA